MKRRFLAPSQLRATLEDLLKKKKRGKKRKKWEKSVHVFRAMRHVGALLSPRDKQIVRICAGVIVLSVLWIIGYGWAYGLQEVPKQGGEYTEGVVGRPVHINPLYSSTSDVDQMLTKMVYSGLVRIDGNQRIVGDLAESWSVSDDGKEYTFVLRKGVEWHDGEPFTADDVVFTVHSIQDPEYLSPLRSIWEGVEVEKEDDYTVVFRLPEPSAPFLANMTIGILPAHIWQNILPLNAPLAEYNSKPIGLGPWKFSSLTKDKQGNIRSMTLARNDRYYGSSPWLDRVTFKFFPNFEEAYAAFKERNVDGLGFLPADRKEEAREARRDVQIYTARIPQYIAVFFNEKNAETLASKKVRQALAYAVDKKMVIDAAVGGDGVPVRGPLPEGYVGYHPLLQEYSFDLLKAAALLEDAGWKINPDTRKREKDGDVFSITLTAPDQGEYVRAAEAIEKTWESLGIDVEVQLVHPSLIQSEVIHPRAYDALLFAEMVGSDPDLYPFWHSSQRGEKGLNLTQFADKRADSLLEEARTETDAQERGKKYIAFQEILVEEAPAVFLYSPLYLYPVSQRVQGVTVTRINDPSDRLQGAVQWYIRTKKSLRIQEKGQQ